MKWHHWGCLQAIDPPKFWKMPKGSGLGNKANVDFNTLLVGQGPTYSRLIKF